MGMEQGVVVRLCTDHWSLPGRPTSLGQMVHGLESHCPPQQAPACNGNHVPVRHDMRLPSLVIIFLFARLGVCSGTIGTLALTGPGHTNDQMFVVKNMAITHA